MVLNDLLLNIKNMSESEYKDLKEVSRKLIVNYAKKKDINTNIVDLDDVIDMAISQYSRRYTEYYKTAPGTLYYIILTRRFSDEYNRVCKIAYNEKILYLNDYEHNHDIEKALTCNDNIEHLEKDIMALKTISDKNKEILLLSAKGFSNSDISKIKGISRQRVSQLLKSFSKNYEIKALLNK